jgi:hypothetical protein
MIVKWNALGLSSLALVCIGLAGCGGGAPSTSRSATVDTGTSAATAPSPQSAAEAPSDAQSAATGDIPDSQAFLTFTDRAAGYSIRYPEGWTRTSAHGEVSFQNRANVIHVVVNTGSPPTPAAASAAVAQMKRVDSTVALSGAPRLLTIGGSPVIELTYTRLSKPDPVTGKQLPIVTDRYEYSHAGKTAVVDLGTAKGVDNVDAYRMISRSFRWR